MKNIKHLLLIGLAFVLLNSFSCHKSNSGGTGNVTQVPTPDHVIILMLENKGYHKIMEEDDNYAPYIKSLASDPYCALFNNSHGITHPSQPNYLALYSGSQQGITNDQEPSGAPFNTDNLGRSLLNAGHTFIGYSEDLPYVGALDFTSGDYAKRHAPWAYWLGTGSLQIPSTCHVPFSQFPSSAMYNSLPTVSFIIPNLKHDMHDPYLDAGTAITNGDNWVEAHLSVLIQWVKTNNSLLIIQYDEDEGVEVGGVVIGGDDNKIPTMFIGSMVQGGLYSNNINHYNILRTLEDMYNLPYCGNSASATPINFCWR